MLKCIEQHRSRPALLLAVFCCACSPLAVERPAATGLLESAQEAATPANVTCCVDGVCQRLTEKACASALVAADQAKSNAWSPRAGARGRNIELLGAVYELQAYDGQVLNAQVVVCEKPEFRERLGYVHACRIRVSTGEIRLVNWPRYSRRPEKNHPNFSDPEQGQDFRIRIEQWQGYNHVVTGAIRLTGGPGE